MKICYMGPYKDGTGYSNACLENIMALDSVGVTVVPRSVKMTNTNGKLDKRLSRVLELEKNDLNNIDAVIQHNLPSEFSYTGKVKNIGIFSYETNHMMNTGWMNHLSIMDTIVVASKKEKQAMINSGGKEFGQKTKVIPFATDIEKYDKQYDPIDFGIPNNCIRFYTVSELNKRKNLECMLTAYFMAFDSYDNVILIIKTNNLQFMTEVISNVKLQIKKFKNNDRFAKILVTDEYFTEEQMMKLHYNCDVFVSTSHGESHCLPMIDAMGFGKPVIVPRNSVFLDHMEYPWQGRYIDSVETFAFGALDTLDNLYTGEETWGWINPLSLAKEMIFVYSNSNLIFDEVDINKRKQYVKDKFNYQSIGNKLKEIT